ncbi:hypothetical protein T484DRAFT_1866134 [Baffinella frigidus]|nr:hypothetical protein T484DRAFT_1866134 [Cryptophyta sp. CCMP2293]
MDDDDMHEEGARTCDFCGTAWRWELGFCSLSCTTRDDNRQPEIGDTVLSIALGMLARHWDWNTEKKARGGGDAIVLSIETLTDLYLRARRCDKSELSPRSRQEESKALQEAAKAVWDSLPEELKQKGLTRRPTLAGVVRLAEDRDHFAAVKLDLQKDTVERQRGSLDTNCGIFALTDLRELLRDSPLRCDAATAADGRGWAQLMLWSESDLPLEVKDPAGNSHTVEPKYYRGLSAEIAGQWAAAVPQRHQSQVAKLRNMNILVGSRGAALGEVRVERGHHPFMERLQLREASVSGATAEGEFTGADITCLRQWKDEFLGPPQAGYAARAPAAAGEGISG